MSRFAAPPDGFESDDVWPVGSLLNRIEPRLVRELFEIGWPRRFDTRHTLLRQGDDSRHALLLTSGIVKVSMTDETGALSLLALRRRGDVVGELAAVTGERRSASVEAVVPVSAQVVPGAAFVAFLEARPEAARELIRTEAHRLHWANERRAEFAHLDARPRVARTLLDLMMIFEQGTGRTIVTLSQAEIASLVGIRPATAELALRKIQESGAIEKRYRAVEVLDAQRLRAEATGEESRTL